MKIVTDSGADLPEAEARSLGITVAPLFIQFPDREIGSTELSADEFYDRLRAMAPQIPTQIPTAEPTNAPPSPQRLAPYFFAPNTEAKKSRIRLKRVRSKSRAMVTQVMVLKSVCQA